MKIHKLDDFTKGWYVGAFEPTIIASDSIEVAIKHYEAGAHETPHYHKISKELTAIVSGKFIINGNEYVKNDIVEIEPGEIADFRCVESGSTVVVKNPSSKDDKYIVE